MRDRKVLVRLIQKHFYASELNSNSTIVLIFLQKDLLS